VAIDIWQAVPPAPANMTPADRPSGRLMSPRPLIRGLNSCTIGLNLSAFCGMGAQLGVVYGVLSRCQGALRCIKKYQGVLRVYFVSETAHVELRSGRV